MDILEKDTNKHNDDEKLIEKVNEDFLDTIKQALHISNGLLCDLTDEELHDIKVLQQDAYNNLKGDTEFNLYPLRLAELYKNVLDNIYTHKIEECEKTKAKETNFKNFKSFKDMLNDLEQENLEEDKSEKDIVNKKNDINFFNDYLRKSLVPEYTNFEKGFLKAMDESGSAVRLERDVLNDNSDINYDYFDYEVIDEEKKSEETDTEQENDKAITNDSEIVQRFDIPVEEIQDGDESDEKEKLVVKPFPEEDEIVEDNGIPLKHIDTIEIVSDDDTQKISLKEINDDDKKEITSEKIIETTSDETFVSNTEMPEDISNDTGIEIEKELEEAVDFSNLKFFSDRNIED